MKGTIRWVIEMKINAVDEDDAIQNLVAYLYRLLNGQDPQSETVKRYARLLDELGEFTFTRDPSR